MINPWLNFQENMLSLLLLGNYGRITNKEELYSTFNYFILWRKRPFQRFSLAKNIGSDVLFRKNNLFPLKNIKRTRTFIQKLIRNETRNIHT